MVTGLLGNESSDSNRFTLVTPKSENDVRLQATLGNQNPTDLPAGVVRFNNCLCHFANFSFMRNKETQFNQCDLSQAVFQDTTMNKTKYKDCKMIQTTFLHASLKNIDLSTCLIEAIEATPQDVSGAIIDEMQASAFIHLLNIKIKEA